jgi:hypothetical protein
MSIILSLAGDGISDDLLAREGYRQVARISGKEVVRIFGTRKAKRATDTEPCRSTLMHTRSAR